MRAIAVALIAGLFISGCAKISCAKSDRFDPEGNDAHLIGNWTINGQPGNAENCTTATATDGGVAMVSVSQIEIVLWNEDESEPWIHERLRVDCAPDTDAGVGVAIDTRTDSDGEASTKLNNDPLLKAGEYRVQWVAVASNGDLIDCKSLVELSVPEIADPDNPAVIALTPVDIMINESCDTCPCS